MRQIHIGTVRVRPDEEMRFEVESFPALRNSTRNRLQPGRYHLSIAVVASNARARYYTLDLRFDEPEGSSHANLLASTQLDLRPSRASALSRAQRSSNRTDSP